MDRKDWHLNRLHIIRYPLYNHERTIGTLWGRYSYNRREATLEVFLWSRVYVFRIWPR